MYFLHLLTYMTL